MLNRKLLPTMGYTDQSVYSNSYLIILLATTEGGSLGRSVGDVGVLVGSIFWWSCDGYVFWFSLWGVVGWWGAG